MAAIDDVAKSDSAQPTLAELTSVFARIGCLSFGGPAAQIAMMHRAVVEEKRWLSEERFLHALNYCMLLPGPEAQQLATYIGWLTHGTRGGVISGLLFILPGLVVITILSAAYALWQETTWLAGLFFGLKAAVLAIVVEAVIRLSKKTLKSGFLCLVAATAFVALFIFSVPFPVVVLAAASAGFLNARRTGVTTAPTDLTDLHAPPSPGRAIMSLIGWIIVWQLPLLILWAFSAPDGLTSLFSFFSKMALVTFGGAYAVLAYVAQVGVEQYGWLKPGEMLDGLALAETTPGPLVLVLSFVGFLTGFREASGVVGGVLGALLVAWATFVPSFIFIFAGAPYIERLRGNRILSGALSAITAAIVGVILNLAIWFGLHVLFREVGKVELVPSLGLELALPVWASLDPVAAVLFVLSAVLLFRMKLGMMPVLGICAAAGLAVRLAALM
ncbi:MULTISPECIES: chromate efflux transporter [Rhizobiaceae]|jgi:chromate transporter|uniref:Chromate transporter n=1 Tax=Aliirhizobium cellulosilyticum TaxID=393664 RepID=A0A7W6Y445_9HYPH|nr:chromate efflux transporter [Rhizobium cellulosilyticum]MBB4348542.1 chromate transporter [Rhizobium cellulosilyticum]MBB4411778.1 chromate transporter [Rhizobium cellulosilyticum]MBB4446469.1 chromate transporter [Rhizobium cellulosilyticum]